MKDTKDTKINPSAFYRKSGSATLGQVVYQQRYGELTEGVMQAMRDITEEFAKWDDQQRVHVLCDTGQAASEPADRTGTSCGASWKRASGLCP